MPYSCVDGMFNLEPQILQMYEPVIYPELVVSMARSGCSQGGFPFAFHCAQSNSPFSDISIPVFLLHPIVVKALRWHRRSKEIAVSHNFGGSIPAPNCTTDDE
jgi:hypothetical protein